AAQAQRGEPKRPLGHAECARPLQLLGGEVVCRARRGRLDETVTGAEKHCRATGSQACHDHGQRQAVPMSEHPGDTLRTDGGPARVALLSDVHGNLPAFEAVLADVRATGVDAIWNLGDLVGYGAQPDECVALAKDTCDLCLIGNHDLVVTGQLAIEEFSMNAAIAAPWTKENIRQDALAFLDAPEPADERHPIGPHPAT